MVTQMMGQSEIVTDNGLHLMICVALYIVHDLQVSMTTLVYVFLM